LHVNLAARHHGRNVLAALHAADALGLPLEDGELRVELSPWRGEELSLPDDVLVINDAYNANPLSMRAALEHLTERANGRRRVAVLGDMAELGPDAPAYHREIGRALADAGIEEVIAVGTLAAGYLEPGVNGDAAESPEQAVELLAAVLRPGDVVLVKGSRAVGLEAIAQNLTS
jgi:UDP-N-acetylmuramoyl-tripeptide--D-alanyl-D-alanine ligase